MEKDVSWNVFFENNERFADFVNACGCKGKQIIKAEDLKSTDSKNIQKNRKNQKSSTRYRDIVRKVAFGINFAIVGIEHQENVNYAMPLSMMHYDLGEYDKQKRKITKAMREKKHIGAGEYLYGFGKDSRLHPVVTFVLYSGENWNGATELKGILDFSNIPESIKELVQNYKINMINVYNWQDTSVFRTDLRQVFDFIRYSKDKNELKKLVQDNPDYERIAEDAYDVIAKYAHVDEIKKEDYMEGDAVNMCLAMKEWAEEERAEGRLEGSRIGADEKTRIVVRNMLKRGMAEQDILVLAECSIELLEEERANI